MKNAFLIGFASLLLAGCSQTTSTTTVTPDSDTPAETVQTTETTMTKTDDTMMTPWILTLDEQNTSGQKGTAALEEKDGKVLVTLNMTGTKSTVAQPAHIHVGSCPTPGAVKFPLTDVKDGTSVTTIETTFAELKKLDPLAINVHKSAAESKVYTSCGNVK